MPRSVSANEAKNRFGSLMRYVSDQGDEVIIESHGKPKAVMVSVASFEELERLRDQQRRRDALAELRALRAEVRAQNEDLTEEEALEFAVRASREMIDHLAATGKIRFVRDQRSQASAG